MNCSTKIYHQNELGSSRKCECNEAVHLTFGNISLLLNRSQLSDFATYIGETIMIECGVANPEERSIFLPTRDFFLMFAMTYNELKSLFEILDQTMLMLEVDDALFSNDQGYL